MRKILIIMLALSIFLSVCEKLYGWGNKKTHPALTDKAISASLIDGFLKTQLGLDDGISTELNWDFPTDIKKRIKEGEANPDKTTRTILEWTKIGSTIEDEDGSKYPRRARHHFHDSKRNAGLDNKTDHPEWKKYAPAWKYDFTGESAATWAINGTAEKNPTINDQSWTDARSKFYDSLTNPSESNREELLAEAFLSLGCVLHMVEDIGVPAHARNDFLFAHYRKRKDYNNPFESWVEKMISSNGSLERWVSSEWTPTAKVYNKTADYFDTDTRNHNDYLGEGVSPPDTWGLAEVTNYQFLSFSTIFISDTNSLYYFLNPMRIHCNTKVESGRTYLYGYGVDYLARKTMSQHHLVHDHLDKAWCILGKTVFDDYGKITIPRTIDYATGLINYFFRGRLSVEPNWADPNIVILTIINDSNNSGVPQVLKGGDFELYWDKTNGDRADVNDFVVSGWGPGSVLDYNTPVTATFTKPADAAAYTLVYRGDICENPTETDPCDPNALAVAVFRPGYPVVVWGRDDYGQISGVPDSNDFIAVAAGKRHCLAIRSDGSLGGWGYDTHGECNVPPGNDYIDISAGIFHSVALTSAGEIVVWGRDNVNQITDKPDGNDFVAITAGDYHSLAVQSDGVVKAWGNNNHGQTRIYGGAAGKVHTAVAAGENYSFLMRDDDMLISWGGGDWIQPDIPRYHYRQPDSNDFVAIAAGSDHIVAFTCDGKAFDWDWPFGDFPFDYFERPAPPEAVYIDDIDAGYDFGIALRLP